MSQNAIALPTTGTINGLDYTTAINNALDTIVTNFSGASAPASPKQWQFWYDTANGLLKQYNGTSWHVLGAVVANAFYPYENGQPLANLYQGKGSFSGKNKIINGDMRIDQRNFGSAVTPTTLTGTLDRWRFNCTVASKMTIQQLSGLTGFRAQYYLRATTAAAYTCGASDFFPLFQGIEGYNLCDLNWGAAAAQAVTISFWVRSSIAGQHSGAIQNGAGNRSYPFAFTINAANTWEYKTITIAGDTSGTWSSGAGLGAYLVFNLGAGSSYVGAAGAWSSSNLFGVTGSVNVVGTAGATFDVTLVQFEAGSYATPFEFISYAQALALCQRYYYKFIMSDSGGSSNFSIPSFVLSATQARATLRFPVDMRGNPTMSTTGTGSNYSVNGSFGTVACNAVPTLVNISNQTCDITFAVASGLTAGHGCQSRSSNSVANVFLGFDAEL